MCFKNLNIFSFSALIATEEKAIDFVINCGLVSYNPIKCDACGYEMRLKKRTIASIHHDFRCTNYICHNFMSGTTNTCFFGSKLKWKTILEIIFMWCEKRTLTQVTKLLSISNKTAIKWFNFCREICAVI